MIIAMENDEERPGTGNEKERMSIQTMKGLVSFPMAESEELIDMERNLKSAQRIITHMESQINDLLEYTKMEKGLIKPKKQSFSKEDLYKQIEYLLQPLCEDKNLSYELEFSRMEDVTFKTDKGMFVQLFWQLLDNAAQYSDEGGKISFEAYTIEKNKKEITNCFVVRDNGIGMSKEFQEYLFQPFMREKNRMFNIVDGTGLGLYIVHQIVKLMRGEIQVESQENKGTSITIKLTNPICNTIQKKKTLDTEDMAAYKDKRILLCEERAKDTEQTRKSLEKAGVVVEVATDGYDVIERFKQSQPYFYDAILLNVRMTEMNGFEVTNGIRQLDRNDAYLIPIVALIRGTYDENIAKPIEFGMDAQIEEPVEIRELLKILEEFWKKYKE